MNKKAKIGLSILGVVFGISAVLSGCAPTIVKKTSSALPPVKKPVVVMKQAVKPMPKVSKQVPSYVKEYPWLANYDIQDNLNNIHFAFNKSILTPLDKIVLKKDAVYLRYNPNVIIQIQGNCDRRGSEAYNLALGWRRANAAKAYLEDLGVANVRLKTISYGKEKPLCGTHGRVCYARNRRDHFVLVK
ncbi:OmpA family protein [Candidatus Acidulodesulfobacterium sp. H_13]|uniref:OmpA family protein n=1 Tax=Candidatus Acidulodesulfobacterium sp. H_13 TaxID=3395470 RepID=UPI003AF584BE